MKLVVGLGNPGTRYRGTRHNLGFRVVDHLAARWDVPLDGSPYHAEVGEVVHAETRIILAKPLTFMNASGTAITQLRSVHAFDPCDVIAVYDDLDLPFGRVRVRARGGTGGHRGVLSLIEALGPDFPRVRVGIGRPPEGMDTVAFVLQPFEADEIPVLERLIERAADAVESVLRVGLDRTMDVYNRSVEEP